MKVIDLLNKIANGEINEDTLIEFDNGYKDYCSVRIFFDRYIVDRENLNCEVEIIEDTPKVQVEMTEKEYFEYLDNKLDTPKENKKIEKFKIIKDNSGDSVELIYDGMKLELTLLQAIILDKINEIIDKINGE